MLTGWLLDCCQQPESMHQQEENTHFCPPGCPCVDLGMPVKSTSRWARFFSLD
jgi:hypothetical protein